MELTSWRLVRDTTVTWPVETPLPTQFTTPTAIAELMLPLAQIEPTEVVWVLPFDRQLRLIPPGVRVLSRGTEDAAAAQSKDVLWLAVQARAAKFAVVHNHPSDKAEPSVGDMALTAALTLAGTLLGMPLVDHIIIGVDGFYSFAEDGKLSPV